MKRGEGAAKGRESRRDFVVEYRLGYIGELQECFPGGKPDHAYVAILGLELNAVGPAGMFSTCYLSGPGTGSPLRCLRRVSLPREVELLAARRRRAEEHDQRRGLLRALHHAVALLGWDRLHRLAIERPGEHGEQALGRCSVVKLGSRQAAPSSGAALCLRRVLLHLLAQAQRAHVRPDLLDMREALYRPDRAVEVLDDSAPLSGDPVLRGFALDLTRIW